ncbi:VWA domain-containing protein, partial [Vibrio sp. TRT 17S01]|uniref:VWA domain-containing protein n=1 Tax=Vibrio sp. TRT 17S01 TaxID=3418505 RepID=UPI003CFA9180
DVTVNLASQTGSASSDDFGTMVVTTADGTVVNPNTDGSYTIPAGQTNLTVTIPTTNDTVFEGNEDFTVMATAGDGTVGSDTGTATILDNDAPPTITSIQGSVVSEEGLADGIADSQGSSDTTNSASASGSFVVGDVDSDTLSVSLTGPTGLMSGGESIVWSWDATSQTLVGSTSSLGTVAEISLSEPNTSGEGTWNYDIVLSYPIDHPDATVEDTVTFNLGIVVSDGQVASTGDLTIVVEDDRPVVTDSSAVNVSLLGPNETPIASSEGILQVEFGADGFGSLKLTGAESGLQTADGSNITISIDSQNPNRLLGRDENGELVFDVQLTPATGKWEYLQYKPMTNPQGDGDIDFTFTVVDGDGDSVTGAFAVNPYMPPSVGDLELNVSEEGLSLGIVDGQALEGHSDTTNSVTDAGTVSLSGHIADVTLGTPTGTLTSDGATVTWTLSSDGKTLTGSASGEDVITISVDNNGQVSTQLSGGIDHSNANGEDSLTINVPINVEDQAGINASGNIAINVEDDSPVAERIHHDVDAETKVGANVQLVLDTSGSMKFDAGNGKTRLSVMKEAVSDLLHQYEALGDVQVQIIIFHTANRIFYNGDSTWFSVDEALELINTFGAWGNTDYDGALASAEFAWEQGMHDKIPNATNVSYFMSDGDPTGYNALNSAEVANWTEHLKENDVTALSYGIGTDLYTSQLDLVAYDGFLEVDSDAIMVPDVNDLPPVLLQSVVQDVGGNLLSSHSGGDGAIVKSITIEGVTFTFNGSSVSQSGTSSMISSHFDSTTNTLSIYVDSKHSLVIDMDDGNYTFYGAADDRPVEVNFNYKLEDNDGDSSESILSFEIDGVNVTPDIKSEGDVVDTVQIVHANSSSEYAYWSTSGISGTGATTESFTHQETINGMVVDVGAAGDDVFMGSGDDTIYLGDSHANIDDHEQAKIKQDNAQTVLETFSKGNDSDFLEDSNVEDSAMSISGTSNAFVDLGHGGGGDDHIYGQGGVDIMFGGSGDDVLDGGEGNDGLRGGSGNDRLVGGAGNDILIGGTGDDLLTGGEGYDIFKWVDEPFSVHEDVITDFNRQQDQIDLSELLTEDETMDDLLASTNVSVEGDINSSSADLKLTVEHDGDTQVIVLQDAASQFSDYISSNDMAGLLNELVSVKNVD